MNYESTKTQFMKTALILSLFFLAVSCAGTKVNDKVETPKVENTSEHTTDNAELELAISEVIKAFNEKNQGLIQKYISDKQGVYILHREGVFNQYSFNKTIDFNKPVPANAAYVAVNSNNKLSFENLPSFSCDTEKWSKTGLFCEINTTDNLLSTTAKNLIEYRGDNIPSTDIDRFLALEKISHRVVLTDAKQNDLVFYLSKIEGKWYLTILDRISSQCSA